MKKPVIGITMGDPAGIGPEITVKALAKHGIYENCRPVVIGDASVMERAVQIVGMPTITINAIKTVDQAEFCSGAIDVLDLNLLSPMDFTLGKVSAVCGEAAFQYIKTAIDLAMDRKVNATVTNPINKEAINLAGHYYSGHTEIYADLTKTAKYAMMLADGDMRISHVSTHVSLREACDLVKKERILDVIRMTDQAVRKIIGSSDCKIGVAGLNPHNGENGLFGTEETEEITPAILAAREEGLHVEGPVSPDTLFSKLKGGWYDAAIAMYHDQGHIPLKVLGFNYNKAEKRWDHVNGVNITLGLPIIRTSVDHGTAFDQAGKGGANEFSLVNAIGYGIKLNQTFLEGGAK